MLAEKLFSKISSLLFLSTLAIALAGFPQSTLSVYYSILMPPLGLGLSLVGVYLGEKGVLRFIGIWGNAVLLVFSAFTLFTYTLFVSLWGSL